MLTTEMFCNQCGSANEQQARFCSKCGVAMTGVAMQEEPAQTGQPYTGQNKGLWNPKAVALWSIVFTPVFGAYLQALNWRALGNQENAKTSMIWFWGSLLMVVAAVVAGLFPNSENIVLGLSIGCLVGWYSQEGKKQVQYVKQKFGTNYPRKSWWKVLLLACACLFAQLFLTILLHGVVHGLD